MEINKKSVGNRIKSIRASKGMTLEEFGELLNSGKSNVSKWEKGYVLPNPERIKKISEIGNISVDELLHGSVHTRVKEYITRELKSDETELNKILTDFFFDTTDLKDFALGFSFSENGTLNDFETHDNIVENIVISMIDEFIKENIDDFISQYIKSIDLYDLQTINKAFENYLTIMKYKNRGKFELEFNQFYNQILDLTASRFGYNNTDKEIINHRISENMKEGNLSKKDALKKLCNDWFISEMEDKRLDFLKQLKHIKQNYYDAMIFIEENDEFPNMKS